MDDELIDDPCSKDSLDYRLACELTEWERDAHDGAPTSAHAPCYATPCRLVDRFPADLDTPPPIPNPLKKTQLAAAKRLEKELKAAGANKGPHGNKSRKTKKEKKTKTKAATKDKKEKKQKQEKKPRKPNQGPLAEVMKEYIKSRREAEGLSYQDALKAWGTSSERAAIVDNMSYSEQKRRRYN